MQMANVIREAVREQKRALIRETDCIALSFD
jgi:hypothetical protein